MPALIALLSANTTLTKGELGFANGHVPETLRCVRLVENATDDPLQRYAYLNTPPTVRDMQLTCAVGQSVSAKMDCTDPDDFARNLQVTVMTNPTHGTVTVTGLTMEYQAEAGYVGKDSFTWKATDPTDESGTATVTIQVSVGGAAGNNAIIPKDIPLNDNLLP